MNNLNHGLGVVLFFGRKGCLYSKKIKRFLLNNTSKLLYFESKKFNEKLKKKYLNLNYDYIICFRSFYILKKNLLKKVNKYAINFHPGPPEYRGVGAINHAFYNNSKFYGCTAHLINNKIDNGKIIDVKKFYINKKSNLSNVLNTTHKKMFNLALSTMKNLMKYPEYIKKKEIENRNIKWSKKLYNLRDLNSLYEIKKNIKKNDLSKKIRATKYSIYKPYIILHGIKFILEK